MDSIYGIEEAIAERLVKLSVQYRDTTCIFQTSY